MNAPHVTYDFIVTGFGCAGMSLLFYLLKGSLKDQKILIIDSSEKTINDRTWCYWAEKPLEIHPKNSPLVFWENISISNGKNKIKKPLGKLKYFHVSSSDFYNEIKAFVNTFPNVNFIHDTVNTMEEIEQNSVIVRTSLGNVYSGKKVFNSIPDNSLINLKSNILRQVFVGWKIKTKNSCFEPDTAVMMDFVNPEEDKTDFFYILPFSENEALVEYTAFTTQPIEFDSMECEISHFIQEKLGQDIYEITFREQGSIPMTTFQFASQQNKNIINLGSIAGCGKPSTGYTFHTIQKHCQTIVNDLESKLMKDNPSWQRNFRFGFYDNIILNIAKKWPKALPKVFFNLFEKNSGDDVLRFLNEETSLKEEIKLLSRLKFPIFIKSLIHYEQH